MKKFSEPKWVLARMSEVFVAVALTYLTINLIEYREAVSKASIEPEKWFTLQEIYVPDHTVGSDPMMIYDRDIHMGHRGFWVAEVQRISPDQRAGVFQNACSGSGVDDYDENEVLGRDNEVSWSWFFGRPCVVPPGTYRVQLIRDMTKPDYPVKQMRGYSNTFQVLPE